MITDKVANTLLSHAIVNLNGATCKFMEIQSKYYDSKSLTLTNDVLNKLFLGAESVSLSTEWDG